MFRINDCNFGGYLTADPILKTTEDDVPMTRVVLGVGRILPAGAIESESDFIVIIAWRRVAEIICESLKKGSPAMFHGELQSRSYVDKQGVKKYVWELIADRITLLPAGGKL